jgi:hypothetical protein
VSWLQEIAVSLSAIDVIFFLGIFFQSLRLDFWEILYGLPKIWKITLQLPLISAFLGFSLFILVLFDSIVEKIFIVTSIWYFVVAITGISFAVYLKSWNFFKN